MPWDFSIKRQIYPHLLVTPRQAPTPDLGNNSSSGGQFRKAQQKGMDLREQQQPWGKRGSEAREGTCVCAWFPKSCVSLWLYVPWKPAVGRSGSSWLIPTGEGVLQEADSLELSTPLVQAEICGRLQESEKSLWQQISPGSPTLFISIIKSANTYHLSEIRSNNKQSYRAYYGQWWDINL